MAGIRTEGLLIEEEEGEESGKRLGEGEVGVGGRAATRCGGSPAAVKAWVVAAREENGLGRLEMPGGSRPVVPGKPENKDYNISYREVDR